MYHDACHNDTCPVGVATQNKDLRALFTGKAQHVVNFMYFIAEELREILASLGLETVEELVGRTDLLQRSSKLTHGSKAAAIQIENLIEQSEGPNTKQIMQDHHRYRHLNYLYPDAKHSIQNGHSFTGSYVVNNEQRDVGVITGSAIARQYGEKVSLRLQYSLIQKGMPVKVLLLGMPVKVLLLMRHTRRYHR